MIGCSTGLSRPGATSVTGLDDRTIITHSPTIIRT
jgi:hypothetical protein